jgi:hypothetical protein
MNLPVGISVVTVNGRLLSSDGSAAVGSVDFAPSVAVAYTNSDSVLLPKTISVDLDFYGRFSIVLPCTDDPAGNPLNWCYSINERCAGGRVFSARILGAVAIQDYTDLVAIPQDNGVPAATTYTVTTISVVNGGTP